jgi:hypothetical protein
MADATNALALHMAGIRKGSGFSSGILRHGTVHRHIRAMQLPVKGYTPHFKVACMVAAGKDTGNYTFELTTIKEQLQHIYQLLTGIFTVKQVHARIIPRSGYTGDALITKIQEQFAHLPMSATVVHHTRENNYYKGRTGTPVQYPARHLCVTEKIFSCNIGCNAQICAENHPF